ncbi:MAG: helix-turn-helix domain-containing protein [Pseudomonadota bacterium]
MSSIDQVSERADPAIETLKAVGDRWSMLIMFGAQQTDFRFREAQSKLGLAHNVLSARLKLLIGGGLLERAHAGRNAAYRATDAGLGLLDVILAMQTWALDWLSPGDADWQALIHKPCGKELKINCICKSCGQTVSPLNVSY